MRDLAAILGLIAALGLAAPAEAETYPARPVTIVVPLTPGTTADILARLYGDDLSRRLGQPVVIENKAGAGGMIGAQFVAAAVPDGYTILMANSGLTILGSLNKHLPYDPVADFAGIAMIGVTPALVVVSPALGVGSLRELVALAKQKPGRLTYASAGIGSSTHLAGAYFSSVAGIDMVHVPYKTGNDILADLVSGRVDASFVPTAFVLSLLKDKKLQALAVGSPEPLTAPIQVPSARSAGVDYEYSTWYGFLAPARTPPAVLAVLSAALAKANEDPALRDKVMAQGIAPETKLRADFDAHVRADMRRLAPVLKDIASKMTD